MTQSELLDRLESDLNEMLKQVRSHFADQAPALMIQRSAPNRWSAQECFAHLNAQFDYYLPRIELALHKAKARRWMPAQERKSNGLGRRAIQAVNPANLATRPRRSPKSINPSKLLQVRENELKIFLINQELMLRLLRQAREVDISKASIKPMGWHISCFLLGDLLEYLTRHSQRHLQQAHATILQ